MKRIKRHPIVLGPIALIPLTRGLYAIVDVEDLHLVEGRNWCASPEGKTTYAVSANRPNPMLRMHRVIADAAPEDEVDHRDLDGLNCSRENLRLATHQQNLCNTRLRVDNSSGHKGVSRNARDGRWYAYIRSNGVARFLGSFLGKSGAAKAYNEAAVKVHGEFARSASR